jgi:Tfp pilus assembly protein PilN
MRVHINLASQKYEDVRQFYTRWGIAIGLAGTLTVLLAVLAWMNYSGSTQATARTRELEQRIASLEKKRAEALEISNRPENHDVNAQKNFWNKQFIRRSFSWTQLLNDLQRIMPPRAYVTSVRPEITNDNRLRLNLTIKGDNHDNALELVRKMEKSERFRNPLINTDSSERDQRTGQTTYKLDIVTYYTPASAGQPHSAVKEGL